MMMVVNAKVSGTPVPLPIRKATGSAPHPGQRCRRRDTMKVTAKSPSESLRSLLDPLAVSVTFHSPN